MCCRFLVHHRCLEPAWAECLQVLQRGFQGVATIVYIIYSMAALLLPERLVDSFGMRRNMLSRMTFCIIVWITRGLVKLLPRHWRGVPAARRRE